MRQLGAVLLALGLCGLAKADAHTARLHITEADAAYRRGVEAGSIGEAAGAFAEAAEDYTAAIEAGAANGYVFYNRGNARVKSGRVGAAIADYERALRMLPRFGDLRANLSYARALASGEQKQSAPHDLLSPLLAPHTRTTLAETAWAAVGLYVLTFALLTAYALLPRQGLRRATLAAGILCALACASLGAKMWDGSVTRAVVTTDDTAVRSGNAESFAEKYRVAEGAVIRVLEEREGWYKIRISRDEVGWVPQESVEAI